MQNVIIVGSGPAGYTAAIYCARANLQPLLLTGNLPGGQLTQTTEVENYPGFEDGVLGFDLMEKLRKQAERFGATVRMQSVADSILRDGGPQQLTLADGEVLQTQALIVATGAAPRWLGLPSEEALKNKGVSSCATCDGAFFRGVPIAVIGGGDSALEEALFLTHFASKVIVVHRRDQLRASKIMQDRAFADAKIEFRWNSEVTEIRDVSAGKVTAVVLRDVETGQISLIECGAVFVAIGHLPQTQAFAQLAKTAKNYLAIDPASSRTNIDGVFAAGDCADSVYRQAITAAAMGCRAAIDAARWLEMQTSKS